MHQNPSISIHPSWSIPRWWQGGKGKPDLDEHRFHIGGLSYDNYRGVSKLGCSDPEIPKSPNISFAFRTTSKKCSGGASNDWELTPALMMAVSISLFTSRCIACTRSGAFGRMDGGWWEWALKTGRHSTHISTYLHHHIIVFPRTWTRIATRSRGCSAWQWHESPRTNSVGHSWRNAAEVNFLGGFLEY